MNNVRLKAIEESQSGVAKKVLACVPMADNWSLKQIAQEFARSGSTPDMRIIEGCIHSLRDSGLVKECRTGLFMRVGPKDEPVRPESSPGLRSVPAAKPEAAPFQLAKPSDPLERMANVSKELLEVAARCVSLAGEYDEAALEMEERIEKAHADNGKLRQLQDLLKSIGQ